MKMPITIMIIRRKLNIKNYNSKDNNNNSNKNNDDNNNKKVKQMRIKTIN